MSTFSEFDDDPSGVSGVMESHAAPSSTPAAEPVDMVKVMEGLEAALAQRDSTKPTAAQGVDSTVDPVAAEAEKIKNTWASNPHATAGMTPEAVDDMAARVARERLTKPTAQARPQPAPSAQAQATPTAAPVDDDDDFTVKASDSDGDFELPPPGSHPAVLIGLVHLGTHNRTFGSETKTSRRILLVWELAGVKDSSGQPFIVGRDFTLSLHEKSSLRGFIEGWESRRLVDGEDFRLGQLIGRPCLLSLKGGTSGAGKRFVDVASAAPPISGMPIPQPTREPYRLGAKRIGPGLRATDLPDWLPRVYGRAVADVIRESAEYKGGR